jgi:RNA polymerase-binding transcription factor DksA
VNGEAQAIQEELTRTRDRIAALEKSLEEKPDYGLGKGDPAIVHQELNRVLLQQSRGRAEKLEQALLRLRQGTYGTCERCGGDIHPDRLAVLSDVRLCIRCARTGERR